MTPNEHANVWLKVTEKLNEHCKSAHANSSPNASIFHCLTVMTGEVAKSYADISIAIKKRQYDEH